MKILLMIILSCFLTALHAQVADTTKQAKKSILTSSFVMPSARTVAGLNNLNTNSNAAPSFIPNYKKPFFWQGGNNGPLAKPSNDPIAETPLGGLVREAFGTFSTLIKRL